MARPIELTSEQTELVKRLGTWFNTSTKQWYAYTGPAGTGKTTVLRAFIEECGIKNFMTCAYVGKAVTVLAKHGLPSSTIHSMIYNVIWVPVEKDGEVVLKDDGTPKMRISFSLKENIAGFPDLLIVDEATMVNDDLAEDILSFGIKTIFVGDNNQLPPVFGVSSVMLNPNFYLTKIMRQAEDDPIVYLSQKVLKREYIKYGNYGKSSVLPYLNLGSNYTDYDIILCGKNRIRDNINNHIRHNVLGINAELPVIGDKLICRQNNWERCVDGNIFLTTGLAGTVSDINRNLGYSTFQNINFAPDITLEEFYNLKLDAKYIILPYDDRKLYGFSQYSKFEFGYAITVHMSQGSEYENVLYADEWFYDAEMTKHIRYTAITRARNSICWASEIRLP